MIKEKRIRRTGDCFERAFKLISTQFRHVTGVKLVHGIVWHEQRGYHIHGWVELGGACFDYVGHGKDRRFAMIPKDQYYRIGKIKTGEGEIKKYTPEEAIKLALEYDRYYFSDLPCKK